MRKLHVCAGLLVMSFNFVCADPSANMRKHARCKPICAGLRKFAHVCAVVYIFAHVCAGLRYRTLFTQVYCVCAVLDTVRRGRACEGRRGRACEGRRHAGPAAPLLTRGTRTGRSGLRRGRLRRCSTRSCPGPSRAGPAVRPAPAFVFAAPAVAAHAWPESPGARLVRPGPDRPARPPVAPVADIKICDTMRDCKTCSGPRGDGSASARGDRSDGPRGTGRPARGGTGRPARGVGRRAGGRVGRRAEIDAQGRWRRRGIHKHVSFQYDQCHAEGRGNGRQGMAAPWPQWAYSSLPGPAPGRGRGRGLEPGSLAPSGG